MTVDNFDEAIEFINAGDHPLALYIFTNDSKLREKGGIWLFFHTKTYAYRPLIVFSNTRSGSCICNDVVLQIPSVLTV